MTINNVWRKLHRIYRKEKASSGGTSFTEKLLVAGESIDINKYLNVTE